MASYNPITYADFLKLMSIFGLDDGMIRTNGTEIFFISGGTTVAKIDANGNLFIKGQITTGATTAELT